MSNSHDEIKKLLDASRKLLNNDNINEDIRRQYGLLTEQGINFDNTNATSKINVAKSVNDTIDYETADTDGNGYDDEEESGDDKTQGYRISGGILVLHGKEQTDLELTTDEKITFQETMDDFINQVSDMVDFNKLNVYSNNVEWSGKLIEYDIEFFFSIGEENGVYINGEMLKTDAEFLELLNKLKSYYEKFKSKWSKILSSRKKTDK
jgi:hypothetical protein